MTCYENMRNNINYVQYELAIIINEHIIQMKLEHSGLVFKHD